MSPISQLRKGHDSDADDDDDDDDDGDACSWLLDKLLYC